MAYIGNREFLIEVAKGNVAGHSLVHKFGRNSAVTTTLVPITSSAIYQTPTSAASLEIVSTSSSDDGVGSGARVVTIEGIDANGDFQTQDVTMDGTVAAAVTGTWLRVFRMYVKDSGTYATQSASSHVGTITLRVSGGGATWGVINLEGTFGLGQSLIGAYTVPSGKTAYILNMNISIEGAKKVDCFFFKRENITDITGSFSPMRVQNVYTGLEGTIQLEHKTNEAYSAGTDIGFLGKTTSGTSGASVEFELLLVDN